MFKPTVQGGCLFLVSKQQNCALRVTACPLCLAYTRPLRTGEVLCRWTTPVETGAHNSCDQRSVRACQISWSFTAQQSVTDEPKLQRSAHFHRSARASEVSRAPQVSQSSKGQSVCHRVDARQQDSQQIV